MKKYLGIILGAAVVYILNQIFKSKLQLPITGYFCRNYLNDVLCGIVFPAYVSLCLLLGHRRPLHKLVTVIALMTVCGAFWEFVAPVVFRFGTSDIMDIFAYDLGGLGYFIIDRMIKEKDR